uniref:Membrane-associated protein n=1 Tax=Craspedostauros australis TaxID=1486917 RepID=A0A7R9WMY6_9STRA|mmetsp:Transcript_10551/g.29083  ORF Transcript_10551/g.29083 Transcript_10551/m.29083 type:complete len:569 (+) Transcript_10551:27-1733(+)|eukprot:CAMPEP_0198112340 /NCGR_PEP_ID=MMETSP1442-20131203/4195_1 /TAXON_ID= /ORGANISM="Craspedostauros australis, Strain CCMP3328" /LENGTH=568 /DNA_ID=CAMNT_0043769069 /DNA_START=14 /DNA_END=1720 /DNA_ORIENTATION=+
MGRRRNVPLLLMLTTLCVVSTQTSISLLRTILAQSEDESDGHGFDAESSLLAATAPKAGAEPEVDGWTARTDGETSAGSQGLDADGMPVRRDKSRLIHVGIYGLGHRLLRASSAWHLGQALGMTTVKFRWGTCGEDHATGPDIFEYLFETSEWDLPQPSLGSTSGSISMRERPLHDAARADGQGQHGRRNHRDDIEKQVRVRNDVYGYVPGQSLKDFGVPLNATYKSTRDGPFGSKLRSDAAFYRRIETMFRFRDSIDDFMEENGFRNHVVIGLHLRLGNGEQDHFQEAGRQIANETEFVANLTSLIASMIRNRRTDMSTTAGDQSQKSSRKSVVVFLATDAPARIAAVKQQLKDKAQVPVILFPQIRVEADQGVSFTAWKGAGQKCLKGWQAMLSDMIILGHTDVVIAARHSAFTQSLPLSLVFQRADLSAAAATGTTTAEDGHPEFCEVSTDGTSMSCHQSSESWLFRDDPTTPHYSLSHNQSTSFAAGELSFEYLVQHKLLVHLPDVERPKEFEHVLEFLNNPLKDNRESTKMHTFGRKRFNPRYRRRNKPAVSMESRFNFTMNS